MKVWAQFLTFALFTFCMFSSVSLTGFSQFYSSHFASLCAPGFLHAFIKQRQLVLLMFVKVLSILLLGLVIAFFDVKIGVLHQFIFARFAFLCIFCDCVRLRF